MQYSKKRDGIIGTIIFHIILLMVCLYWGLSVPLPLPAEEGILMNFGFTENASGITEAGNNIQDLPSTPVQQQSAPSGNNSAEQQETLTQDYEEAPSLTEEKKEEKAPKEEITEIKETKKTKETTTTEKKEAPAPEPRKVNKKALFPGKTEQPKQSQEGIGTGAGNQGVAQGETGVPNYQTGDAIGGGGSFSLAGRSGIALPQPEYNHQEEGIVVVEITVDRRGRVINAVPGVKGSTTLDTYLCEVAKQAALKSRFNADNTAQFYQKGTITYRFELQ